MALRREGVTVSSGALGDYSVDLNAYGWFPDLLPSEEQAEESEDEGEEELMVNQESS